MKTNISILLIFFIIGISCDTTAVPEIQTEKELAYEESLSKWKELKIANGDSYVYQTHFSSWTGFGSMTELKIEDGFVTSRSYQAYFQYPTFELIDEYTETIDDLGSHDKGALPLTIDELYETCASDYLVIDEENNAIYFDVDSSGIMKICGYFPYNCADDCFRGISIDSFEWI